ncbi:exporter of polyketide antibiotics [Longimycelium tulufanense]|uniref:Exporter of polyketide antibiotics n=1 Tax=Longimycelium tulufanense TaxID=907463 RepID=A0A8J3CEL1_9PSEU|nr:ABC transporter permease [Longimycelium tulufanense]GGM63542.1 exporter of polyketide antibiotics [Longimycelium tulufanense]
MGTLVGTGSLVRLALRRDRVRLPIWIVGLTVVPVITASALADLYPTVESRRQFGSILSSNPSLTALIGPVFDPSSIGGLTAWRVGGFIAVLVALMSLLTVVRHSRAEEEAGRLELLGATVVGRHAPLTAALVVAFGANLVLAALVALGLAGLGEPAGSVALGLSFAAVGWVFAALAAVTEQLTAHARTATGLAGLILGVTFLLRVAGDASGEDGPVWLSWLSPIGWAQRIRPFADERWWVLAFPAAFAVVLVAVAHLLVAHRDLDAGLIPTRSGPETAAPSLRSPLGLAWRLHRASLAWWTVAFAVVGVVLGGIADGMRALATDNPQLRQLIAAMGGEKGIIDSYFSSMMGVLGLVATIYGLQAALRPRAEEVGLRAEPLLATPTTRLRWLGGHVVFALVGVVVPLAAGGAAAGLVHGLRTGDAAEETPRVLAGALAQLPAVWVTVGIAVALFGLLPRMVGVTWAALVLFLLVSQFGPMLQLNQWLLDVSPFTHVPKLPGGEFAATPLAWLALVAVGLTAAGFAGFRRRDITTE